MKSGGSIITAGFVHGGISNVVNNSRSKFRVGPGLTCGKSASVGTTFLNGNKNLLTFKYSRISSIRCAKDGEDGDTSKDPKESTDWDAAWKSRSKTNTNKPNKSKKRSMQLPNSSRKPAPLQKMDDRTQRLANFWSNDTAFLFAIAAVFLLIAFYASVYFSGGIPSVSQMSLEDLILP
uniref:Transmembrane protein n=1 Tax=Timspurckia oligopyrenoides TaxID=708627 RepID=A0A7S0ZGY0_9RHOD|mmetsp:Transcript_4650/g.8116  ORF Transcript_4650/g.8116 Transcript_4650/m.8116 type:complete len:178 (+) Transcript_4650:63-596(+)